MEILAIVNDIPYHKFFYAKTQLISLIFLHHQLYILLRNHCFVEIVGFVLFWIRPFTLFKFWIITNYYHTYNFLMVTAEIPKLVYWSHMIRIFSSSILQQVYLFPWQKCLSIFNMKIWFFCNGIFQNECENCKNWRKKYLNIPVQFKELDFIEYI